MISTGVSTGGLRPPHRRAISPAAPSGLRPPHRRAISPAAPSGLRPPHRRAIAAGALFSTALLFVAAPLHAQELDRSVKPAAGPTPAVRAPAVVQRTLPNGLALWVVTDKELPTINAQLVIRAGAAQDGTSPGIASVTAGLLDEGTTKRSATEFAEAADQLGVTLRAGAGTEQTTVTLSTLTRTADSAFALMGEMVTQPAFSAEEIERDRKSRLQNLARRKDQPTVIATETFDRLIYGDDHAYGHAGDGTTESISALTRDGITGFYRQFYLPNNAVLVIVGDVTPDQAARYANLAFANWKRGTVPAIATAAPAAPTSSKTGVFLVDKPGAAQSEIRIGHAGVPRMSPDYYPLSVLNAVLGGQFTSRINLNLREDKGYTYGARSSWSFDRGPGPFTASAGVFTAVTDSSLVQFMNELTEIRTSRPATDDEVAFAKGALVRSYPRLIETDAGVANRLADLALLGLPPSELTDFVKRTEAVTAADVNRVAKSQLHPDKFTIVVVGDLAKIQAGIEALNLGPVTVLDADGR
jgi:predicted Zn-dependent peptidase